MDVVLMVLYIVIVLSVLVFIHEGGHFLAARAFGVRVTEFMLGLPGPNIGFTWRGTKFGVTAVPLGGYAKVCGMEPGPEDPHLEDALAFAYANGTVYADDVAEKMGITLDEAIEALYVLEEWGCLVGPKKTDEHNVFRTRAFKDKRKGIDLAEGSPRLFDDAQHQMRGGKLHHRGPLGTIRIPYNHVQSAESVRIGVRLVPGVDHWTRSCGRR